MLKTLEGIAIAALKVFAVTAATAAATKVIDRVFD